MTEGRGERLIREAPARVTLDLSAVHLVRLKSDRTRVARVEVARRLVREFDNLGWMVADNSRRAVMKFEDSVAFGLSRVNGASVVSTDDKTRFRAFSKALEAIRMSLRSSHIMLLHKTKRPRQLLAADDHPVEKPVNKSACGGTYVACRRLISCRRPLGGIAT